MEEILKQKRKIRGGHRGYATQLISQVREGVDELELIQTKIQLEDKLEVLKRLDEEILARVSEIDDEEGQGCMNEIKDAGIFQKNIYVAMMTIEKLLKPRELPEAPSRADEGQNMASIRPPTRRMSEISLNSLDSSTSSVSSITRKKVRAKLPKLELKKFTGRPVDWQEFWDGFQSAVHENEELSEVDKFSYLRYYLEEPARKVISGFALTEKNYEMALNILEQRFAKPTIIKRAHMNELINASPVFNERNVSKLRELYDVIETHYRGLEALGVDEDSYSSIVVPVLIDKIPENVRICMIRGSKGYQEWSVKEMLEKFKDELEIREQQLSTFKNVGNNGKEKVEFKSRPGWKSPTTASALG